MVSLNHLVINLSPSPNPSRPGRGNVIFLYHISFDLSSGIFYHLTDPLQTDCRGMLFVMGYLEMAVNSIGEKGLPLITDN
jgi:hypothetical protein